jgi:hypothetical protein
MQNTGYSSRLRYLAADDVDDAVVDFDGLDVQGPTGDNLGDVDGFVLDMTSNRVLYVVVDSGGWFRSRRFLVPIGHATIDREGQSLRLDVSKDVLQRYPEFREERFREFSDADLRAFESGMASACCPDEALDDVSVSTWHYDTRRHYRQPDWWTGGAYAHERLRPVEPATYARTPGRADVDHERDHVVAGTARSGDDVSPHHEGRAQPGDVLGIETGGERTGIGDTADDEDKRRRTAERAARDDDEPRQSER